MNLLHILNDGPGPLSDQIIEVQSQANDVEVIDLSQGEVSYGNLIDKISSCDRVISW